MVNPTRVLKAEHELMGEFLAVLDRMVDRLHRDEFVPEADLARAITVAVEFGDKCHHAKEEQVLFPALARASPLQGAELARRLTSDHRAFRKVVGSVKDLLPQVEAERSVRAQVAKLLESYGRILREHIRVEDERLLPEVERILGVEEQAWIAEEFERIEGEEIGQGKHNSYLRMVEELAASYRGEVSHSRRAN